MIGLYMQHEVIINENLNESITLKKFHHKCRSVYAVSVFYFDSWKGISHTELHEHSYGWFVVSKQELQIFYGAPVFKGLWWLVLYIHLSSYSFVVPCSLLSF